MATARPTFTRTSTATIRSPSISTNSRWDCKQTPRAISITPRRRAHGLPALVPQHGTLLRVSKDGTRTEILATGFRAPNGVCLNPDGTFFLSDQEGFWTPKNRINWVKPGGFYGNMWGYHDVTDTSDSAMEPPVCWITNAMDRSPAELVWVESEQAAWKPLRGALLSLSYGNGKIFVVPHEVVGGQMQGGVCCTCRFPRSRLASCADGSTRSTASFTPAACSAGPAIGLSLAASTGFAPPASQCSYPSAFSARQNGLAITFTGPLDKNEACRTISLHGQDLVAETDCQLRLRPL